MVYVKYTRSTLYLEYTHMEIDDWAARHPELLTKNNKYVPKLNFAQRCAALAAVKYGLNKRVVAAAFGINRGTLGHIIRPESPHYRDVRKEYFDLGHDRFIKQYLTPDVMELLDRAAADPDVQLSYDQVKAARAGSGRPNPKADKYKGRYKHIDPFGDTSLIEIAWVEDPGNDPDLQETNRPAGWYIKAEGKSWRPGWFGPAGSCTTSKTRLDWLLASVGGTVE